MKKVTNLKLKNALKATILSGVTLVSLSSCDEDKTLENSIDSQEVTVEDYVETTNILDESVDTNYLAASETTYTTVVGEKEEKTTKLSDEVTKESSKETTKSNENTASNKTTQGNSNTTTKTTAKTTAMATEKTTVKATTKTTEKTTVTTTKPTTTKTTTVTTEPPVVTQAPREYNKYDLLDSDSYVAAAAYEYLANQLCDELYNGYGFNMPYGFSFGYSECRVLLAMMNHDQGISPEVLASDKALGIYSIDEILDYSSIVDFEVIEDAVDSQVDYTKYIIDDDLANFINTLNREWKNYKYNDKTAYDSMVFDYYSNNNLFNPSDVDNYFKLYYVATANKNVACEYQDTVNTKKELYYDNVVLPIYNSYTNSSNYGRSYVK